MREHTPGPWKRSTKGRGNDIFTKSTFRVGPIATTFARNDSREQEANACLIAAAPELLEALKLLQDAWDVMMEYGTEPDEGLEIFEAADAAIAKAEGQDQKENV